MPTYIEAFSKVLLVNSRAVNYNDAIQEWVYSGERWKSLIRTHCICGHPITEICLVRNRYTGAVLVIGNCCIKKFSIIREHWNKSKANYLVYTLSKCTNYREAGFCYGLQFKLQKYGSKMWITLPEKIKLEQIAGVPYRWRTR